MLKITLKSPFGQPTLNQTKLRYKLAKTMKKEPRKEIFPWDLGLLFGKPMRYEMISRFNIFKIET